MALMQRVSTWIGLCVVVVVVTLLTAPASWAPWFRTSTFSNTAKSYTIEPGQRLLTLFLVGAILMVLTLWLARGKFGAVIVGADNRYSKSKAQLLVWFIVVVTVYLSTLWLRLWYSHGSLIGGITIPAHLLQLAGLSGLSFAAAKGITQSKQNAAKDQNAAVEAAAMAPGAMRATTAGGRAFSLMPIAPTAPLAPMTVLGPDPSQAKTKALKPSWKDLLSDDSGKPDLGDLQMVLLTLVAVAVYLVSVYFDLGTLKMVASTPLPDIDQSLLALLGVSHLTYAGKKATSNPNP